MLSLTARSATSRRSPASGNTMLPVLPPSSSTAGLSCSAQTCAICLAAAGPPVKLTFSTFGLRTSAAPASGPPARMLHTPAGTPACSSSRP